jgi:Ca2+-binding RTX toxin-like protein
LAGGGFVVSWYTDDPAQDRSISAIKAQLFDAAGAKIGTEFLVDSQTKDAQFGSTITGLAGGGFVVSWYTFDPVQDGNGTAIKAQIFDAAGAKIGTEFLVNSQTTGSQYFPTITSLGDGGFVVSWYTLDPAQDGSGSAIKAQIFDADGAKNGTEFLVNSQTAGSQSIPTITGLTGGGFVVSWETGDAAQDGSGHAIKAQIYLPDGAVNTDPALTGVPALLAHGVEDTGYVISAADLLSGYTDAEGDELGIAGVSADHGTIAPNEDGSFTLTPDQDYSGTITLSYDVIDGQGGTAAASQTVEFDPLNDAPALTGTPDPLADGEEDTAYVISTADLLSGYSDVDGDKLDVAGVSADHGTIAPNEDGSFTLTPDQDYFGTITLSYVVIDGQGGLTIASRTVEFTPLNDAPALTGEPALLAHGSEDTAYVISAADLLSGYTDVDGDKLSIAKLSADYGKIALNDDGSFTLIPDRDYFGTVTLRYAVIDGQGGRIAASQTVEFDPLNDAPVIKAPSAVTVAENLTGTVLTIGGYDPDPGATTQFSLGGADGGLFNLDAHTGALSFKQTPDFESPADLNLDNVYDLTVSISDGTLSSSQALTVTVSDVVETGSNIVGTSEEDRLDGTTGNDRISGGNGIDQISGADGDDLVHGGNGNDEISGGRGADLLFGDAGHDVIDGGIGNDVLYGGSGFDHLTGGAGDDKLYGDQGKDILIGGDGNDLLVGGESKDTLTGNGGADIFVLGHTAAGADLVMDFEVGVDKIQFAAADFGLAAGPLDASMLVLGGKAVDHHAEFVYNEALGKLFWDADGVGGASAVIVATFDNKADLSAADFTLV